MNDKSLRLAALLLGASLTYPAEAATYRIKRFDFPPGDCCADVSGINASGQVIAYYRVRAKDGSFHYHSFQYHRGIITPIGAWRHLCQRHQR